MDKTIDTQRIYEIFHELNLIPRPSHHEQRAADYLCQFAQRLGLSFERDDHHCVVIRKPATPGHESAEPVVLLNHMDMVCVGMENPLDTPVEAYVRDGWMMARGTSLGADNGIGLSMALAVLESQDIVHGPLEVITTTNEEDGMTGAAHLSPDFLHGRKVINLDSEDYDTITTGAAGATLQYHRIPTTRVHLDGHDVNHWLRISIGGGLGGHSGVDINKGRCSATTAVARILNFIGQHDTLYINRIETGEANAAIASAAEIIVGTTSDREADRVNTMADDINRWLRETYPEDARMRCTAAPCEHHHTAICREAILQLGECLQMTPQGVVKMSRTMADTVETSNNIGRIATMDDHLLVTTHTRSFIDSDMAALSSRIADIFRQHGAQSETVMTAPAWQEDQQSDFLRLTSDAFQDTLGWRPRMVAMHFVLEAGFFVQKYPGIQIASIGPRIVSPHSTGERVELSTVSDIWQVLQQLLRRQA